MKKFKKIIFLVVALCFFGGFISQVNAISNIKINDGTVIYYNPVTNKICNDYVESNSKNENKNGCLKWYAFLDNESNDSLKLLLDHNTTAIVQWNSVDVNVSYENSSVYSIVQNLISESGWNKSLNPRLITASEIAEITGNNRFDETNQESWYYFDSNNQTLTIQPTLDIDIGDLFEPSGGHVQGATTKVPTGESKYAWLFDYLYQCENYGCNDRDLTQFSFNSLKMNLLGYWTSSTVGNPGVGSRVWSVGYYGNMKTTAAWNEMGPGIRPVITVSKNIFLCDNYSDSYKITYETNGGNKIDSETVSGNKSLVNAIREGYIFDGWYTDAAFKNKVTSISPTQKKTDTCIVGFNDVTVYAKWNKEFKDDKLSILGDSKLLDNVSDISVELKDEIASLTDEVLKSFVAYDIVLKDKDGKSVEPGGNVKLSLLIPEGYNKNNIGVYRVEGDKLVDYKVTINGEYAEIETDHFSTYIIGEKIESKQEETPTQNSDNVVDNDANQEKDNEKEKVDNPDTGANVTLFLVIGIVLIGIGCFVIRIINKKIYTI